ncbi:MAG: poly(3-hydroxyalkanoate) depolymerase [Gammaproteobacteria bacterium]|nr:poly(3-hydroxyalkanoate) depolymerase [Gammaproteobacteria bacterium]
MRVVSILERPGTPLLIFNGIGASVDLLQPLLGALTVPVIAFDLPGVGATRPSLLPKRMPELATLARTLLDVLEIERCHIMGVSWGGGLAQQFAWQYPERTDRLVLAATSTGHLMVPPRLSVMLRMATPLRYLSAGYFKTIAGDIYGGDFRNAPERAARHARLMTPPSVWGYLGQLYALSGWTSLLWLHKVRAPALVMAGEDDPIIPLANARILVNRLPNARLSVYDCGHLFVLTRLDRVSAEIDSFLSESGESQVHHPTPHQARP